ncbi:MAG TPA: DNA mismatch repair endonuclease MutL [Chlamydiales bacterium]|jgi:DNA mismatch repair protein MutL|nr:DNA mismatch repair endonuclease MutL [Chlamydiales bacterium]
MGSTINVLPDFVIDQIAAGEVLENPASAVKELAENSLDAGCREIRIEIEGGGLQRILIEDDGCGMSSIDAALCLRRHATSKIRSAGELETLVTMGFRGEALAALASVSHLTLKTSDGNESTKIVASAGVISSREVCARNRGTSIEARNLFFNAPARLKFQKSPASCAAAVLKVVETLSLSHSEVHFSLYSNGKLSFEANAKGWKERVEEVRGPFAHCLAFSEAGFSLKGLLSRPGEGKATRSGQTLFVNRRPIVSPFIAKAVKEGYGTRMVEALFPSFVLFLEVPPEGVDVNVHPQKKEVRFRDEGKLFSFLRKAVASLFESEVPEIAPLPWEFTHALPPSFAEREGFPLLCGFSEEPFLPLKLPIRPLALLGNYLLLDDREEKGWTLLDLPGAEARILFEAMEREKPPAQALMWPLEMELDSPEQTAELLRPLGIESRTLGKRLLAIDALPLGMKESLAVEFIRLYRSDRKLAASLSRVCRGRSRKFTIEEGAMIWDQLQSCKDRVYDPLGKRIVSPVSEEELAKRFDR